MIRIPPPRGGRSGATWPPLPSQGLPGGLDFDTYREAWLLASQWESDETPIGDLIYQLFGILRGK